MNINDIEEAFLLIIYYQKIAQTQYDMRKKPPKQ